MAQQQFGLEGMHCASCAQRIEKALRKVEGVADAHVNLATHEGSVTGTASPQALEQAVAAAGYTLRWPSMKEGHEGDHEHEHGVALADAGIAIGLAAAVMVLGMGVPPFPAKGWIEAGLTTVVLFWSGRSILGRAWTLARHRAVNMDTLVALGALAAYFLSFHLLLQGHAHTYFESAAMIIAFILTGRALEERARKTTDKALRDLADSMPRRALRIAPNGQEEEVAVSDLRIGERFWVRPGEKVATDGALEEGTAELNEALLTGESLPVTRYPGEDVLGGSVNVGRHRLMVRATKLGSASFVGELLRQVKEAQSSKPRMQRLADKASAVFVPVVIALAILTGIIWWLRADGLLPALVPAISVLVIACPCALGLATPVAVIAAMGHAARRHLLVRSAQGLEDARNVTALVLDKTGTLTTGEPQVVHVQTRDLPRARDVAYALLGSSTHPLSHAVARWAKNEGAIPLAVNKVREESGQGVEGSIVMGDKTFKARAGRLEWAQGLGASFHETPTRPASAVVYLALDAEPLALFELEDTLRSDARSTIETLKSTLGLTIWMATGDRPEAAKAVAEACGIEHVAAALKPEDKTALVKRLQKDGAVVAMVGDGLNDAPALAAANVSLAVGRVSDLAASAATMVLPKGNIALVADAILMSRRAVRVMKQNLGWAFAYNIAAIPLAMMGQLTPMIAAAAMAFSSLSVVLNALRLR